MRPRKSILKVHRWLSLIIGVWVLLQGLSGAVLAFQDQVNAWSRPELYHHTKGDKGPAAAMQAARPRVPDGKVGSLQLPAVQGGVYVAVGNLPIPGQAPGTPPKPGKPGPQRLVFVDPGTGHVNGTRDTDEGFTHWLARWHDSLLQDEFLGTTGRAVTGWLGLATILIVLSGLYIWYWPGVRRWATALRIRGGRMPVVRQRNLHRTTGLLVSLPLLVVLATGVALQFPTQSRSLWYRVTPGRDAGTRFVATPAQSTPQKGAKPLTLAQAIDRAEAVTGGTAQAVTPAFGPTGAFSVKVSKGWDPYRGPRGRAGNVTVSIDQFSGQPVRTIQPSSFPVAGQAYEFWLFPTHAGSWGGFLTRVLWLLTGLGVLGLGVTGTLMYLMRRADRAKRRKAIHIALPTLTEQAVEQAERESELMPVLAGTDVVRQGQAADFFYLILEGEFEVRDGDELKRTLGKGKSFGEIGLLQTGYRTATVTAVTDGELLVLSADDLNDIVERARRDGMDLHRATITYVDEREKIDAD
jgi:uncharacterized iron-regulated membrane protein